MYVEVTVIFFWSLGKRAAPIDDSGLRKERSGNTVDACAERSSNRSCDGRGTVYITFNGFRK